MKKLIKILVSLFVVFLIILIAVPLFVDVDKYRPQLVSTVNQNIHGTLSLGKLKLSLVSGIKIYAESIELKADAYSRPVLNTDQFHIEIPFSSLLSGGPRIIAVLKAPKILLEKNSNGKMNVMSLMGSSETASTTAGTAANIATAPKATTSPGQAAHIPVILAAASFGLRIEQGELKYEDAQSKANYAVSGLDLSVKDLGLTSSMSLNFTAPVKGSSPSFHFGGVVKGQGKLTPIFSAGTVRSASGAFDIDADGLEFTMPNLITKTSGMPLSAKLAFEGSEKDILLKVLEFHLFDYAILGKGLVTTQPDVGVRLDFSSNEINLEKLHELIPMLKNYALKGMLGLNTKIEASSTALKAYGEFKLAGGEFSMPGILKGPLQISVQAGFTENSLNIMKGELKGPDSDLALSGTVQDFMAPKFSINANGKNWNIDKTIVLPAPAAAAKTANNNWFISSATAATASVNPMLEFAKNPILAKASGTLNAKLASLIAYDAKIEAVSFRAQLNALVLKLTEASFKTFGGTISSTGEFDLKSPSLTYKSSGKVTGISAKEAVANYFPRFKNTLDGTTDADWNVSGSAYPDALRLRSLKGTAKISARDGHLRTIDFKETIQGTLAKVPLLKNAKAPNIDEGFKSFKADMSFSDGNTKIEPIYMLGQGKGLEIKGKSFIKESFEQETFLDVFDPNNILPKEIHASGKPSLALHVTGLLTAPQVDYGYTVSKLVSTAGKVAIQQQIGKFLGGKTDGSTNNQPAEAVKSIGDALKKKFKF